MEGYLLKWTNYVYGWSRRYFILTSGILYYSNDKGKPYKGAIHLDISDIISHKNPKRILINTGISTVHLKAFTTHDAKLWIEALRENKSTLHEEERSSKDRLKGLQPLEDQQKYQSILNYISRLWVLESVMQEKLSLLQDELSTFPEPLHELMGAAKEFKTLSLDTLNLLEEESSECTKQMEIIEEKLREVRSESFERKERMERRMTLPDFSRNQTYNSDLVSDAGTEDFQDARSQYSPSFCVPSPEMHISNEIQTYKRNCLPAKKDPNTKYNIWKVIKDSIGGDLSKMAVPVYFNEPLSMLQRFSEDLTYNEIIVRASECPDPALRIALIACFAVSCYAPTRNRTMKPFNPILGETFELQQDGFNLIAEQVSHHPPVTALHCQHENYSYYGETQVKSNFKGTFLRIKPLGFMHLFLHKFNDHYTWNKVYTDANNIIIGKMWLDHHGVKDITNKNNGFTASIRMKKKGWFSKKEHEVDGTVMDPDGTVRYTIYGNWSTKLMIRDEKSGEDILGYEAHVYPEENRFYYHMTDLALQLNMPPEFLPGICPTDSRCRPDQRALESGDEPTAISEKLRLEEKQRAARRKLEESGMSYSPRWFKFEDGEWKYLGGYWEDRVNGSFNNVPDIF